MPLRWPGREPPEAVVRAERRRPARRRSSPARGCEPVPPEERAVVVAGEEARLLALGAPRDGEPGARRLGSRRVLVLLAEREPDPLELLRIEAREHVRLVLRRVGAAVRAAAGRDARRCARSGRSRAGRSRRGARTRAARRSGSCRCSGCTGSASRRARSRGRTASTTARRNSSRRSSVTCGSPSRWQVSRAAITASGEQQARSASGPSGSSQRRSVTPIAFRPARSSATALSTPPLIATAVRAGDALGAEDRADRVRERVDRERLAADRRRLEQRQPGERPLEPGRVRLDDAVAVDAQAHGRPVAVARRVSEGSRSCGHGSDEAVPGTACAMPVTIHPAVWLEPCEPG